MEKEKVCNVNCCECKGDFKKLNLIKLGEQDIYLCDECLQELNRKIVEHLAEKNL